MNRTPIYIVCSPRPRVGKTLVSRLLTEYLDLENKYTTAFDINLNDPSLIDYLPKLAETASIDDTIGQMQLMDQLIANDGAPKVIDLGFHAFDSFFRMADEIGFTKEAERRGVDVAILFIADRDRTSQRAWGMLQDKFSNATLVPVNNEQILLGEIPPWLPADLLDIAALPGFLKTYVDRNTFSFNSFLRTSNDRSSELYKWILNCFVRFREVGVTMTQARR